jgi:hypothetical protein
LDQEDSAPESVRSSLAELFGFCWSTVCILPLRRILRGIDSSGYCIRGVMPEFPILVERFGYRNWFLQVRQLDVLSGERVVGLYLLLIPG